MPLRSVGLALLAGVLVSCCFPVLLFGVCVGCWLCCGSACCCCTVVWGPCCVSFLLCPVFVDFGGWSHFRVPLVHVMSCHVMLSCPCIPSPCFRGLGVCVDLLKRSKTCKVFDSRGAVNLIPSTAQRRRWFEIVISSRDALKTYLLHD